MKMHLRFVYSQHKDLAPKILKGDEELEEAMEEKEQNEIEETTMATKVTLEKIVNVRLSAAQPKNVPQQSSKSKFIKYKPSQQSAAFNSGAKERIIRMVEMPVDPLEPPKFKHKSVPKASGSPPVPVMHSPPRLVTVKDQQDWKNPKEGWRSCSDKIKSAEGNDDEGEGKKRTRIACFGTEGTGREDRRCTPAASIPVPSDKNMMNDTDMRMDYDQGREEREERLKRKKIREEGRRERERERRLEAKDAAMGKKSKITRDRDCDVSEKVTLGMASTGARRGEVMYDQRLFNQEKGMDSGFATDDQHNVYDKG
ncbi:hypothetical protein Ancab_035385 [Ancistrocladus abbreviatus]